MLAQLAGKFGKMLKKLQDTYNGKKVFVTGHTGFKGAWLLRVLALLGADIKGYALSPYTDRDLYNLIQGEEMCESVLADIRDKGQLMESINAFQPEFVFHLAAQPLVRSSYENPAETFEINAIGTANLLNSVKLLKERCEIVLITTDKVYHNNEWLYPYREIDRLGGYDPYSASKACAELVIDSYRNSFFNPKNYSEHQKSIAVGRAGNVIGGGDWSKDRLLPDIARALEKNVAVEVRNPHAVRPWQHVLEPISGYLLLGSKLVEQPVKFSQAFNFGPHPEDALPVKEMVDIAIKQWGQGHFEERLSSNELHEAGLLKLDISKAVNELHWEPKLNAKQAVEYTMNWYKAFNREPHKIKETTDSQILQFLSL